MEDSPSKPSVAELAGRFKGHILPTPNSNEELPFRRRPPCSLKLRNQTDNNEESDKSTVFPAPSKIKMKNSAIIEKLQSFPAPRCSAGGSVRAAHMQGEERGEALLSLLPQSAQINELTGSRAAEAAARLELDHRGSGSEEFTRLAAMGQKGCRFSLFLFSPVQANLALSPTALLPSPKSPEVKLQPAPPSPTTPRSPLSPLTPLSPGQQPSHLSSEEEEPSGFDGPPDGALLPSINKTRARLSFKRRPPTRQHRRSAGEEAGAFGGGLSQSELCSPEENGDKDRDSEEEEEEEAEGRQLDGLEAGECQDVNCDEADAEAAEDQGDLRQEADGSKEEKLKPAGHGEQEEREEERQHDRM